MQSDPLRGILRFEDWFRDSAVSAGYFRHFHVNRKIIKKEKKNCFGLFQFLARKESPYLSNFSRTSDRKKCFDKETSLI